MRPALFAVACASALPAFSIGQQPQPGIGTLPTPRQAAPPSGPVAAHLLPGQGGPGLHLETNLGSFKIKQGSEQLDVGVLDIDFKGTILVSGLKGTATPSAGVKLEYDRPQDHKQVFYGKGHLHVDGDFDGIQWFGDHMSATYRGTGVIQLFGEFDKALNTGYYWYGNDTASKMFWGTNGTTITPTPYRKAGQDVEITVVKDKPKGKG
jgi:hypothetical protein